MSGSRCNRDVEIDMCQQFLYWNVKSWAKILFAEESKFRFYSNSLGTRVWSRFINSDTSKNTEEVHIYIGVEIIVWNGVGIGGRTELVFLNYYWVAQK